MAYKPMFSKSGPSIMGRCLDEGWGLNKPGISGIM